uniref:Histone deacetylase domain-containing protein n=1 Tax=Mucochytrium quahogii TaxID=96639 RepID=A0A7S2WJ63_9STRA|mmetsp:Transcript_25989/g.41962  ORF Transcript_25989/g.41962 Transcript_25989/m.41962 type:complete len:352 (-) Transcript_25989:210-1265(-)
MKRIGQIVGSAGVGYRAGCVSKHRLVHTAVVTHEDMYLHDMGHGHPECPQRLTAAVDALKKEFGQHRIEWVKSPLISEKDLARAHCKEMLTHVKSLSKRSQESNTTLSIDGDTRVSPGTLRAAMLAAGSVCKAVDMVMDQNTAISNAFACVRPPGHHATPTSSMGFCFFNNIAVGAAYARKEYGIKKLAIVDWDVHHGNGTQDIVWNDENTLFISIHQSHLYPGTGRITETGEFDGNVLNIPVSPENGDSATFRQHMKQIVEPSLDDFQPELILVSAGFDSHIGDPLGGLSYTEKDFSWATTLLLNVAERHCQGRLVSSLEGGYNLDALASSCVSHVESLVNTETKSSSQR